MTQQVAGIRIIEGDITRLNVDAIVNAANSTLLGGGGVDGAIHRAAGSALRQHCAGLGGCPVGEARITPGFRLAARHVIHTVGPVWRDGRHGEPALLAACYRSVFALVETHRIESIALPAISCGAYGYPMAQAAEIALRECRAALEAMHAACEVLLVAFEQEMRAHYERALSGGRAHGAHE
jgi:O-acetyl-ADP-ribose deacetylase (regulator of RNase III)